MAGFDVSPVRPSSRMSLARAPSVTRRRERKSSQTAWPCSWRDFKGFTGSSFGGTFEQGTHRSLTANAPREHAGNFCVGARTPERGDLELFRPPSVVNGFQRSGNVER